jgi:hypothetical protein
MHDLARPCQAAFANRSASLTALAELDLAAAVDDAEMCIALEPTWVRTA